MIARGAASIILAGALALGMTGCGFVTPQATLIQYQPSDGVQTDLGDIKVRNAVAVSEDGTDASLLTTVLNTGDDDAVVTFQFVNAKGEKTNIDLEVAARSKVSVGNTGEDQIALRGLSVPVGALLPVFVYAKSASGSYLEGAEGVELLVPTLSTTNAEYTGLEPTAEPTPTGTPTIAPTDEQPLEEESTTED